jgi:hypothetical protein
MESFTALTKFMDNQKTHVVELEFFEIFLPYSFRLIGPQTKQGIASLLSQNRVKFFILSSRIVTTRDKVIIYFIYFNAGLPFLVILIKENKRTRHNCALQRNFDLCVPRKGIARPQSQFPHL